jgi:hypothetical protein
VSKAAVHRNKLPLLLLPLLYVLILARFGPVLSATASCKKVGAQPGSRPQWGLH